jgi:outer membrane protein OmpA-like peptidoglycan-associated protein
MTGAQDGTKELRMLVGVLLGLMFAVVLTACVDTRAQAQARATAPAPEPEIMKVDLYFDSNSARLRADAAKAIQEKVDLMKPAAAWGIALEGHADRWGTPEYNADLAKRRANVVKQFLMDLGVPETSVTVDVIGQDGAVCEKPNRECQKLNRRVHMEMRKTSEGTASPITTLTTK